MCRVKQGRSLHVARDVDPKTLKNGRGYILDTWIVSSNLTVGKKYPWNEFGIHAMIPAPSPDVVLEYNFCYTPRGTCP